MIKAFSQKLMPPFSGQVQIVESDTYRALALDSKMWEIQYVKRSHIRVGTMSAADIRARTYDSTQLDQDAADPALMELLDYMADVTLPLPSIDCYEYWLLDHQDNQPLALVYACSQEAQMSKFPSRANWTALPDAVMRVEKTEEELAQQLPPVNYRLESAVSERAGVNAKAAWFDRREHDPEHFPPYLIREEWADESNTDLCKRYIDRQSPRLLMLSGLSTDQRDRLEKSCEPFALEVARFCGLYPEVVNDELIKALQVEARLRAASSGDNHAGVQNRRDGILYM